MYLYSCIVNGSALQGDYKAEQDCFMKVKEPDKGKRQRKELERERERNRRRKKKPACQGR
jgi:hypothetical protein